MQITPILSIINVKTWKLLTRTFTSLLIATQFSSALTVSAWADGALSGLISDRSEQHAPLYSFKVATGFRKVLDMNFRVNRSESGISVGNPKVAAATLVIIGTDEQLVLLGLSQGSTDVLVRDEEGKLRARINLEVTK